MPLSPQEGASSRAGVLSAIITEAVWGSVVVIPRKIHRIWLGGPMPQEYREFGDKWRALHPEWEVIDWGDDDLGWLTNRSEFDAAESFAVKADIARYEIVLREGGLYVDVDFEPLNSFDDVLEGVSLVVGEELPGQLNNALFGATPGHPLLRKVVDDLPESVRVQPGAGPSDVTGPAFLTRTFRRWRSTTDEHVLVLPREKLYPYSWEQKHLRYASFPEALAVHHWALSWRPSGSRRFRRPSRRQVRSWLIDFERGLQSLLLRSERLKERVLHFGPRSAVAGRRHTLIVPAGPGRLMVQTRHGFPILVSEEALTAMPGLVLRGTSDASGVEFLRRTLTPGDTYIEIGPGDGLRTLAAGWLVSPIGRVCAFEFDPATRALLRDAALVNESLGMPGPVSIAEATGAELTRTLAQVPEVKVLRVAPEHVGLLARVRDAASAGGIRYLDVTLDDRRAADSWQDMVDELRLLVRQTNARVHTVACDGRLIKGTLSQLLQREYVNHLVLVF